MTLIAVIISRQIELLQKHKIGICFSLGIVSFVVFLAAGAGMFLAVEGDEFEKTQRDVLDAKSKILKKYPNLSAEALDEFVEELRIVGIRGLPKKNGTITRWGFSDALFFVSTLVTTVGYGHFTPKTFLGKLLCIVYTAIGIPLTLVHLASYVDRLMKASENYKTSLFHLYEGKIRTFYIRLLHITSIVTFIVLICFILPASFFANIEKGWGMFEGIYFSFISLTTVGLGDLVPAMDPDMPYATPYKIFATFFLIAGVTLIMFLMASFGEFCRNYKNDYEQLPITVSTEKFPINPGSIHTYGSILTQSGKSEADEKSIMAYGQLAASN